MKINLKQAVKYFFSNPSLELIYLEAISNSMDAGANLIQVGISLEEFNKPESLVLTIKDNGVGFTDDRFEKFSKLMEVEETSHKGIGRLVFLSYFETVDIKSQYSNVERTFTYSVDFDEKSTKVKKNNTKNETTLSFSNYKLKKIKAYDYVRPSSLKRRILEYFYPRLYSLKKEGKAVNITVTLNLQQKDDRYNFYPDTQIISEEDIVDLKVETIDASQIEMFEEMEIHYSIREKAMEKTIITALCIDERTYDVEIISDENIPIGYEIIFLLYSSILNGKVDPSRQELTIDETTLKSIKKLFQNKVTEILKKEIPIIAENNEKTKESLINTYPHLLGYFDDETVGFIKRDLSIKIAQERFFKAQKEVLEAVNVTDEVYHKTLELSSRALTEYILYRELIIKKLKAITKREKESEIHQLIIPMRTKYHKENFMADLYTNNVWLLDDKYMTFNTILSDKVMSEVIEEITKEDYLTTDNSKADITLVFSGDPNTASKVDVVVVEIKKRGLKLDENVKAIVQLQQRAIKLMKYYPHKIQRIWFYAIVEFDPELQLWLENNKFSSLFSKDTMYYRQDEIKLSLSDSEKCPTGTYVLSFDALINDAEGRNLTFLSILKNNFKAAQLSSK